MVYGVECAAGNGHLRCGERGGDEGGGVGIIRCNGLDCFILHEECFSSQTSRPLHGNTNHAICCALGASVVVTPEHREGAGARSSHIA
jgi:hypothetical protein